MKPDTMRGTDNNMNHNMNYLSEYHGACQVKILLTANLSKSDFRFQRPIRTARLFVSLPPPQACARFAPSAPGHRSLRRRLLLFGPSSRAAVGSDLPLPARRETARAGGGHVRRINQSGRKGVDPSPRAEAAAHSASAIRLPRSSSRHLQ